MKNFDKHIHTYSNEDIISDINERHDELEVISMHRFPSGKAFKLQLAANKMVDTVLQTGLYIHYVFVAPRYIEKEQYKVFLSCCT